MKTQIEKLDAIFQTHACPPKKELGMNGTLARAYLFSLEAGNDLPDFHDVIWDEDVDGILEACKAYGIREFTISCSASGLLDNLAVFTAKGAKIDGMVKINDRFTEIGSTEKRKLNAIQLSI